MAVRLQPDDDPAIAEAVSASVARVGLDAVPGPTGSGAWWRAGVAEALDRAPDGLAAARYEAARSPRSTRGATRA